MLALSARYFQNSVGKSNSKHSQHMYSSSHTIQEPSGDHIKIHNKLYEADQLANITSNIITKTNAHLHNKKGHPIYLIRQRIQDFFYRNYVGRTGNALYAVFDNLSPVVSLNQNFDSLLVPAGHPSRNIKVCCYLFIAF